MPLDSEKKAKREKKHLKTPKGKATHKKAVAKYDKKRIEGTATIRIDKQVNDRLKQIEGKNDNERLLLLLDK